MSSQTQKTTGVVLQPVELLADYWKLGLWACVWVAVAIQLTDGAVPAVLLLSLVAIFGDGVRT